MHYTTRILYLLLYKSGNNSGQRRETAYRLVEKTICIHRTFSYLHLNEADPKLYTFCLKGVGCINRNEWYFLYLDIFTGTRFDS